MQANKRVEIREPFPEYAWPQVWFWMEPFRAKMADDFAPQTLDEFVEYSMSLRTTRTWGVWRDGELGGLFAMETVNPVSGLIHVVFKKSFWGSRTTGEAARQACEAAFSSGIRKLSGMVFEDNNAVRGMYKRFGFREEGKLRGQTLRGGQPVNMIACGLTLEDWAHGTNDRTRKPVGGQEQLVEQPDQHGNEHVNAELHAGADGAPGSTAADDQRGAQGPER